MTRRCTFLLLCILSVVSLAGQQVKQFSFKHFGSADGLVSNDIRCIVQDAQGFIRISTSNNGLYLFNPHHQLFTVVKHPDRSRNVPGKGAAMSFACTNNGSIFAGTWGNGIFRYNSALNDLPVAVKGVPEINFYNAWGMCLLSDNRTIWMSMQPGIMVYDQVTHHAGFHHPPVVYNQTLRQLAEDAQGNMWLGTQSHGLYRWIKSKAAAAGFDNAFEKFDAVPNTSINQIKKDSKGFCEYIPAVKGCTRSTRSALRWKTTSWLPARCPENCSRTLPIASLNPTTAPC